ncbi:ATP-binding protein [Ramlibacter sp. PS4R-6]|uniref:ATP-binding protein n=1 Tax=Ramlibacter sp. PS4R-6 TaxID=3133438 RepID=UPI00309FDDBC
MSVLVYAMSAGDGAVAERVLRGSQLEARAVSGAAQLRSELERGTGALLVMEEALAGPVLTVVTEYLAAQEPWSDLPILVMTKRGADSVEAQRAVEYLGNVTLLERPVRTMALVSAVRSALRGRKRQYEVRALNARKDQLLATLAHELRNPLAPISNATAVLRRMYPTPQAERLTDIIGRQTAHLTRLVDDLLDVARITNGKLQLQPAPTTVAQVVVHALEIASGAIESNGHRLAVHQPAQHVPLVADHVRLVQAVSNLLLNAAKFTPPGGDISLTVEVDAPWVEFRVKDSGRGIERDSLERIFDMFEQARAAGEPSAGLGLGLHLARAFAELHGGSAKAFSEGPDKGSEFTLAIPAVQEDAAVSGAAPLQLRRNALPQRVLVVDDNRDAAHTLEALLAMHGVTPAVVYDGAAAVAYFEREKPALVVMDVGMPVMNGYDAARRIRALEGGRDVVLVALTGWGQYADKARAAEAGFDFHFVKPLRIEDLVASLAGAGRPQPA